MPMITVDAAISKWKLQPLGDGDIPYGSAVYSLETPAPIVEFKKLSSSEWVVSIPSHSLM